MAISDADRIVNEGNSMVYKATLLDPDDVAITEALIVSITLTLYDSGTGTIINSRNAQNVKNANQVTIHATSGLLTWNALPADSPIVSSVLPAGETEQHIALFRVVYGGNKGLNHEVPISVKQLIKFT